MVDTGFPGFIVSRNPDNGVVWVGANDFSAVRKNGVWIEDAGPTADELKDDFEPVEGKEATTLFHEAETALSSNKNLLKDASKLLDSVTKAISLKLLRN